MTSARKKALLPQQLAPEANRTGFQADDAGIRIGGAAFGIPTVWSVRMPWRVRVFVSSEAAAEVRNGAEKHRA